MTPARVLRTILPIALLPFLIVVANAQQIKTLRMFTPVGKVAKSGPLPLKTTANALKVEADMSKFYASVAPNMRITDVPLPTGASVDLDLTEFNVINPGATISYTNATGEHPLLLTARVFKGKVVGDPNSYVYMAFSASGVMGGITTKGKGYEISTDIQERAAQSGSPKVTALVFPRADVIKGGVCGVSDDHRLSGDVPMSEQEMAFLQQPRTRSSASVDYSVKGAWDGDYEYFQLFNGDSTAAADYMLSIIARVSAVYERDLSCQLVVNYLHIWLTNTDPYTQFPTMVDALEEARAWWGAIQRDNIVRGFVNVFSGKPWSGVIGIAYLNTLCFNQNAIGFCAMTRSNTYQDAFVCAHENGHIFSSVHTHSCSWKPAIDSCTTAEDGGCYTSASIHQSFGTIMSYCSQTDLVFHQKCITFIKNYLLGKVQQGGQCVEASRRLTTDPPVIIMPIDTIGHPKDTLVKNFYKNDGRVDVTVTGQSWAGRNVDQFEIVSEAPPFTLKPGETKDLKVHFKAEIDTASQGVLTVTHTGLNLPQTLTMEAYATAFEPKLALAGGTEINFGSLKIGEKEDSLVKRFYQNQGRATMHVKSTRITGPNRFDFELKEGLAPFTVNAFNQANMRVEFAPQDTGKKLAYLVVDTDGGLDSIALRGDARSGPVLSFAFHDLIINFKHRDKKVLYDTTFKNFFYNSGSDTLEIISYITGQDSTSFIALGLNFIDLAPKAGYDLTVNFFDSTDGWKAAYMVIYSNTVHTWDTIQLRANVGSAGVPDEKFAGATGMTVTPNPTSGKAIAMIAPMTDEIGANYTLRLTDINGRELDRKNGRFTHDPVQYAFKGADLPPGTYYVNITTSKHTRAVTIRLVR